MQVSCRSQEKLSEVLDATVDITANEIGIMLLEQARGQRAASKYERVEAGSKSLDLRFDAVGHVDR